VDEAAARRRFVNIHVVVYENAAQYDSGDLSNCRRWAQHGSACFTASTLRFPDPEVHMAKQPQVPSGRNTFEVSTAQRPQFDHSLAAYVFDARGELVQHTEIRDGQVELALPAGEFGKTRVFIAPVDAKIDAEKATPAQLQRLGAYEPVLQAGGRLIDRIEVPGFVIDLWPFCFCWVRGRVMRQSDNRAVCNARVHICEVDRVPLWILRLPDAHVFRLRDDLLDAVRNTPVPKPGPGPGPDPGPFAQPAARLTRSTLRFAGDAGASVSLNPQPLPPGERVALNPQPLPPRESIGMAPELHARLRSTSSLVVRNALIDNWQILIPWFCHWPHWWWWFRCDEVAVITTDAYGRFETTILYSCGGDHPDLYFWVEYDFGSGFEKVYHPRIGCHTYWNYACGSDITIRITDPRVPGCEDEPDLPGCQVVVVSIGSNVAVREVQTSGVEGLTNANEPFGATLEPRVDFSRTELIDNKGIPYYRWSYQRLSGPDGWSATVDPSSVPLNAWSIMTRDVYRHYKVATSYPSDFMGPMPTAGPGAAPAPNLFRIRPLLPPAGNEWIVLNESIDLATAYFETASLAGSPAGGPPWTDDLAAGRYEMKLELFDAAGALVDWTAAGIDLRITDQDAPFGVGTVTTSAVSNYNRILVGSHTMGFRMVVRVDNNRCAAEILPVGGSVTPDPLCGFHNYSDPSDSAELSFVARHPNKFANYSFVTARGTGPNIPGASTSGTAGEAGADGFNKIADFTYAKGVVISSLLGPCSNAAFSERLDVNALSTNGYGTLSGYDAADNAAFALAVPCPVCGDGDA
jgi:hypothetical protein